MLLQNQAYDLLKHDNWGLFIVTLHRLIMPGIILIYGSL
jgi:hypothetical protein